MGMEGVEEEAEAGGLLVLGGRIAEVGDLPV